MQTSLHVSSFTCRYCLAKDEGMRHLHIQKLRIGEGENSWKKPEQFLDQVIGNTSPEAPIWNQEARLANHPIRWSYIDGCMILARSNTCFM